ncbi:neutral zinc metallopeptidase [Nonomuraea sp. NBC_01738]|uniref:neutral zinc metallopeptidase n=1 Tax=Nonomuraea sp. NBC_01738 TaxID=2976003 RepID=UPI002E0D5DFB|nr:neutral zinc metallopeptidase [Nonomuraea sp. NBC_01738]
MRTPLLALIAGALASVLFTGVAHAAPPAYSPVLTKNAIYKTGKLELKECAEQPVNGGDLDGARVYLVFLLDCLNDSWSQQLAKKNIPFSKPGLEVIAKPGARTACGRFPEGAQALYCPKNKKITFLLDQGILAEPFELFLMEVLAHEYGHHVQQLTGMLKIVDRVKGKSKARLYDESRRVELQAECMSGAFIGSVWHSLGRRDFDFRYIVTTAQNGYDYASHGKASNIAWWLKRGFDAESPNVCNTWAASKSKVS